MKQDDGVFTKQLRAEALGPWPQLRALLAAEGVDPGSVEVHSVYDGGHGMGNSSGELFEFTTPTGIRFSARLKWHYPTGDATINDWRREPQ